MKLQIFLTKPNLLNNTSLIKKLFFFFPLVKCVVQEESMQPLLYPGDTIIVNKLSKITTNDIIVFKNPQKNKRENYLIKQVKNMNEKGFFVEGLNKTQSIDSRQFGRIQKKDIIGKMILKLT